MSIRSSECSSTKSIKYIITVNFFSIPNIIIVFIFISSIRPKGNIIYFYLIYIRINTSISSFKSNLLLKIRL